MLYIRSHLWLLAFYCCFVLIHGYINVHLEDRLCALGANDTTLTLLDGQESAAIITQQWKSDAAAQAKVKYHCEFSLLSSKDAYRIPRGIYVVVTHLKLRKNPKTNECLDYIQFQNDRICEIPSSGGTIAYPLIFDRISLYTPVVIHIDSSTEINEALELRVVVTAHSQCEHKGDLLCDPEQPYSCISRHFLNDNITNCNIPCRDEVSCLQDYYIIKEDSKNITEPLRSRFADDQQPTNYITVAILEEKLKETAEYLRDLMGDNQASLLRQLGGVKTNEKENNMSQLAKNEDDASFATKKFLEEKLEEKYEVILKFVAVLNDRLYALESQIQKYQMDIRELTSKIEEVKQSNQNA